MYDVVHRCHAYTHIHFLILSSSIPRIQTDTRPVVMDIEVRKARKNGSLFSRTRAK